MVATLFTNGRFLYGQDEFRHTIVVQDGRIDAILPAEQAYDGDQTVETVDLQGQLVLPAFVDAHCHLLHLGESLSKVNLAGCSSLHEILDRLTTFAQNNPSAARIEASNWGQDMTTPEQIDRAYIDKVIEKPVYIQSSDLHSTLCNTAALSELGISQEQPDPPGGTFVRDPRTGRLTGWLQEMAHFTIVVRKLGEMSSEAKRAKALDDAFDALLAAGYTAVADLLMEEDLFALLVAKYEREGSLPLRVRAFWHCPPQKTAEEAFTFVERAKELQRQFHENPWLQVNGIKIVVDGVIDSCTAHLALPYQDGTNAEPLWPLDKLLPVIQKADALDLQCAVHAIGDGAVHIAVESIASVGKERIAKNRHRIEHLELTRAEDVERIGAIGITTSVQPVHSDPACLSNWYKQLGGDSKVESYPSTHRCSRAFAYNDFLQAGAPLALGTDAPTAAYWPFPNLYNAVSRRSATDPSIEWRTNPLYALPLAASVLGATKGAAWACHLDSVQGEFVVGKAADFNVIDVDIFTSHDATNADDQTLLRARVAQTFKAGVRVGRDGKLL